MCFERMDNCTAPLALCSNSMQLDIELHWHLNVLGDEHKLQAIFVSSVIQGKVHSGYLKRQLHNSFFLFMFLLIR